MNKKEQIGLKFMGVTLACGFSLLLMQTGKLELAIIGIWIAIIITLIDSLD